MSRRPVRIAPRLAALLALLAAGPAAAAPPEDAPDSKLSATWTVLLGDKPAGTEKLKLVVKPDGRWFASSALRAPEVLDAKGKPKVAKDAPSPLLNVLWREADGRLTKYFRDEDKRMGQGLRAFRRQDLIRIVAVNSERKDATEIPGVNHAVFDPAMWSTLWDWLRHVPKAGDQAQVGFIDVAKRKAGVAVMTRAGKRTLTNKDGAGAEVDVWRVDGLGVAGLELLLDARNRMVGARGGDRSLLLVGWSWARPLAGPAKAADAAAETKDDSVPPDAGDDGDDGVGP
jgi:hypothetical protein